MNKKMRIVLLIISVIFGVGVIGYAIFQSIMSADRGTITIEAVPRDQTITLNGKKIGIGKRTIKEGTYTLVGKRSGFAEAKQKIVVKKKQIQTVKSYLLPNSEEGRQWVKDHPNESYLLEGAVGEQLKKETDEAIKKNELITQLPFIGPAFMFRIDYGGKDPNSQYPDQPIIYIQGPTEEKRNYALQWIRSHGYDPDKMNIVMQEKEVEY